MWETLWMTQTPLTYKIKCEQLNPLKRNKIQGLKDSTAVSTLVLFLIPHGSNCLSIIRCSPGVLKDCWNSPVVPRTQILETLHPQVHYGTSRTPQQCFGLTLPCLNIIKYKQNKCKVCLFCSLSFILMTIQQWVSKYNSPIPVRPFFKKEGTVRSEVTQVVEHLHCMWPVQVWSLAPSPKSTWNDLWMQSQK